MQNEELQKQLVGMSLISSAVETERDVMDYFLPLVHKSVADLCPSVGSCSISAENVRDRIGELYSIQVPLSTVMTLLGRLAKRKGYVYDSGKTRLTVPDKLKPQQVEDQESRLRRINQLVDEFVVFSRQYGVAVSHEEAKTAVVNLFRQHGAGLTSFVLGADDKSEIKLSAVPGMLRVPMVDFLEKMRFSNEAHFRTLREIYVSSAVIALLESSEHIGELPGLRPHPTIFVDSNYALRLLEWQSRYENLAAKELFEILRSRRAEIRMFSFTFEELVGALDFYGREAFDLLRRPITEPLQSRDVKGVVAAIRRRNVTRSDFLREIDSTEKRLEELGITVIDSPNLHTMEIDQDELEHLLNVKQHVHVASQSAPEWVELAARRDVAALSLVRKLRKGRVHSFRAANAWFLTCDHRLYWANRDHHRARKTVPEAILDHALTNLLWIASPQTMTEVAVDHFISHIAVDVAYEPKFLVFMDLYVKRYFKQNPDDLPYADEAYRSLRLAEDRPQYLAVQSEGDETQWGALIEARMKEAIDRKRKEDQRQANTSSDLQKVLEDLRDATQKSIDRLTRENEDLRNNLAEVAREANQGRLDLRAKTREWSQREKNLISWLVLVAAILVSILALFVLSMAGFQGSAWRYMSLVPLALFYAYSLAAKPEGTGWKVVSIVITAFLAIWNFCAPIVFR